MEVEWSWSGVEVKTSGGGGRHFEFRYSNVKHMHIIVKVDSSNKSYLWIT